jgi:hypothetical protein
VPDDLDDFDIRSNDATEVSHRTSRRRTGGGGGWLVLVAALIVLLVGGGAAVFVWLRAQPKKAEVPAPRALPSPTEPTAAPRVAAAALPALAESDAFMRSLAAGLSNHPEMVHWLARTGLVRTLTSVVANIANGDTPRKDLDFLTPAQRFRAATGASRIVADPASYAGYDTFGDVIASIDAKATADAYRATEPLFDAAYRDLGYRKPFRLALDTAIRDLLAVPVPPEDAELVSGPGGFRWVDAELEGLTAAQKQFLRTGPRNVRLVQSKLRELQGALATALPPI